MTWRYMKVPAHQIIIAGRLYLYPANGRFPLYTFCCHWNPKPQLQIIFYRYLWVSHSSHEESLSYRSDKNYEILRMKLCFQIALIFLVIETQNVLKKTFFCFDRNIGGLAIARLMFFQVCFDSNNLVVRVLPIFRRRRMLFISSHVDVWARQNVNISIFFVIWRPHR